MKKTKVGGSLATFSGESGEEKTNNCTSVTVNLPASGVKMMV